MNSLGNIANKVTPPLADGTGAGREVEPIRRLKWRLRDHAGRFLPVSSQPHWSGEAREVAHRVGRCGRYLVGGAATVLCGIDGARYVGLETCGSVWLCPVCASKIAEGRRGDIERMLDAHVTGKRIAIDPQGQWEMHQRMTIEATPGAVYMLTLTIPHRAWSDLRTMREAITDCWTRTMRGAPWQRMKARCAVAGVIRAMEVTHGKNGWHPHLHVLILAGDLDAEAQEGFRVWLADRWAGMVEKAGLGAVNGHGVDFYRASRVQDVGDYIAKWGCDSELAHWHVKKSKGGNRSPWQLLADAADGDHFARMRWLEFAACFAGTRHITMSHGLRDLYLADRELTDSELAAIDHGIDPAEIIRNTGETIVGRFRRQVWLRIVTAGCAAELLEHVESGGWPAALDFLADRNLALRRS